MSRGQAGRRGPLTEAIRANSDPGMGPMPGSGMKAIRRDAPLARVTTALHSGQGHAIAVRWLCSI